jgi:integrin-linked kinase
LHLEKRIGASPSGEVWRGKWQGNEIVAKVLAVRAITPRVQRDFKDEFPRLRYASQTFTSAAVKCCETLCNMLNAKTPFCQVILST